MSNEIINKFYPTNAWTICEQIVGDVAITTIGSVVKTNSHKICIWETIDEKHPNIFSSYNEETIIGNW